MFNATTDRISKMTLLFPDRVKELEAIFDRPSMVYIDYANIYHWTNKLKWTFDLKRIKQLLSGFDTIKGAKFYYGTSDKESSRKFIEEVKTLGYDVKTKPVKKMRLSIDVSGVSLNSSAVLENFIKRPLLKVLTLETIQYLNSKLKELNVSGTTYVEQLKCNFDVEIGRDMLLDHKNNGIDNFILWSGDSDFADPVTQLLNDGKKAVIFATSRRVSTELTETRALIFDIQKIRNFICNSHQIQDNIRALI
ncbi:MAG: protein of unknown function DUF88 [uncultured bacterium]|nr:MAG: protein of unknown function DUF88 [uncultured bacterium]